MKQYVDYYGKGTKKVPLPVDFHLEQAVGALTLHTGVGTLWVYSKAMDIKNARSKDIWRAIVAYTKWRSLQMYVFVLRWQKKKRKLFYGFRFL